ncbi:hypothetical protein M8J76_015461 [Diaphorina citri]|nr:hypothetical protein M8J76_015461 [Diaphorina citri]
MIAFIKRMNPFTKESVVIQKNTNSNTNPTKSNALQLNTPPQSDCNKTTEQTNGEEATNIADSRKGINNLLKEFKREHIDVATMIDQYGRIFFSIDMTDLIQKDQGLNNIVKVVRHSMENPRDGMVSQDSDEVSKKLRRHFLYQSTKNVTEPSQVSSSTSDSYYTVREQDTRGTIDLRNSSEKTLINPQPSTIKMLSISADEKEIKSLFYSYIEKLDTVFDQRNPTFYDESSVESTLKNVGVQYHIDSNQDYNSEDIKKFNCAGLMTSAPITIAYDTIETKKVRKKDASIQTRLRSRVQRKHISRKKSSHKRNYKGGDENRKKKRVKKEIESIVFLTETIRRRLKKKSKQSKHRKRTKRRDVNIKHLQEKEQEENCKHIECVANENKGTEQTCSKNIESDKICSEENPHTVKAESSYHHDGNCNVVIERVAENNTRKSSEGIQKDMEQKTENRDANQVARTTKSIKFRDSMDENVFLSDLELENRIELDVAGSSEEVICVTSFGQTYQSTG